MESFREKLSKDKSSKDAGLTGGIRANVDDLALGPVDLVLVGRGQLSFDHDGVLGPGLQRPDQVTGVLRLLAVIGGPSWRVHIGDLPAVGAARVLPVELSHVPVRPGGNTTAQRLRCGATPCIQPTS